MMLNGTEVSTAALYAVRIGVGVCCSLSILGACAIILSYAAFWELRTTARQLLLNLSIGDILLSLSLLLGLVQNAHTINNPYGNHPADDNGTIPYWLCQMQAFVVTFSNDAAIFWTISVAVYFFITIVLQRHRQAIKLLPVFYLLNWGIPLGVVIWLLTNGSLGYESGTDPAFCSIISTLLVHNKRVDADYPILVGYEIWNYLAFILLPIFFISTIVQDKRFGKLEKKQAASSNMLSLESGVSSSNVSSSTSSSSSPCSRHRIIRLSDMGDGRVVIVPVVYILLKFVGLAVDIGIYFLPTQARITYRENVFSTVLVFASAIGTSIPGFIHGLIFCVLTKEVRQIMVSGIWSALTNCEVCIYDKTFCGCCPSSSSCYSRLPKYSEPLSDKSSVSPASTHECELLDAASPRYSGMMGSILSEYDIVQSPDPTSAVSILQIPEMPKYAEHLDKGD